MDKKIKVLDGFINVYSNLASMIKADAIIFYPYDFTTNDWLFPTLLFGNYLKPSDFPNKDIPNFIQHAASIREVQIWGDTHLMPIQSQIDIDFINRENIRSAIITPLEAESKVLGVVLIIYRSLKNTQRQESLLIDSVNTTLIEILYPILLNSENIITVTFPFKPLISIEQFIAKTSDALNALSFIYLVFTILSSTDTYNSRLFINNLREQKDLASISSTFISKYIHNDKLVSLRILSAHYGSPASFDLLGIGTAFEVLRDIVKDVTWRGEHEKNNAELEQRIKQAEVTSARLDHEKVAVDIAFQRTQLEKAKLENEKLLLEVLERKMDLAKKINEMQLSDVDKASVINVLLPKLEIISSGLISGSLILEEKNITKNL